MTNISLEHINLKDTITDWWEGKRLLFNLIIFIILSVEMSQDPKLLLLSQQVESIKFISKLDTILWSTFFANIPYCIGTAIDNTLRVTLSNKPFSWAIFLTGIAFFWILVKS